jgi:tellurite resistance protein TerC
VSTRSAVWASVGWIVAALAVGALLVPAFGSDRAVNYFAVYVLERTLSLDNVFVFLLIIDFFLVPQEYRARVVGFGIAAAFLVRGGAIAVGAELIQRFSVVTYLLGAILLVFALRMLRSRDERMDPERGPALRVVRRVLPVTDDSSSGRFLYRRAVTPLGLALLALVAADVTFAIDSIPASFGITTDIGVIWLANALALLGLVPLLALVRVLISRFRYVRATLAAVLVFIAVRLLLDHAVEIGPLVSLAGIAVLLAVGIGASVLADRREPPSPVERADRRPPRCPPAPVPR